MKALRVAVNGTMMLYGIGFVVATVRSVFTPHATGFRMASLALAVGTGYTLLRIASNWWARHHT